MKSKTIGVLVVDSNPIVREGLRQFLQHDEVCQVVAEAEDGTAALFASEAHDHDVLLINVILPGTDVFDVIRNYKSQDPERKAVVCNASEDGSLLQELRKCGADGFLGQQAASGEYLAAVQSVCSGGNYFSGNLTDVIFRINRATAEKSNAYGLTLREMEILSLLANGLCNKEIANKYELSVRTVETHRLNIRRKTDSNTLSDLVRVARSLGLSTMGGVFPGMTAKSKMHETAA